jgi:transcriptional regulator with XRE-family HTH domain
MDRGPATEQGKACVNFSNWLKELMSERGMAPKDVSEATGYTRSYIYRATRGQIPPRHAIQAICRALDTDPNYAIAIAGYRPPMLDGIEEDEIYVLHEALERYRRERS